MSSFGDEPFCACQPNAAVRAGDNGDFSFKSAHSVLDCVNDDR
jgi:hypothetical protein